MHINNLSIIPNWSLEDLQGQALHPSFLSLLAAIQNQSKLTRAADSCNLSYRHAWNILREAEAFFNHPVTYMERGKGSQLTELGKVLLQANQRIEARLHTQVESLAMELNAEVHRVLSDQIGILTIYASHGYAVALVPQYLSNYQAELHYHGSSDALRALNAGMCKIAGFNLPIYQKIASQQNEFIELLNTDKVRICRFITRQQGLMVSPEVNISITTLHDLAEKNIRFINRQPRSGTRELFDQLLLDEKIDPKSIHGYDNHEYTHSSVAAHVATGMAEVGFGVEAAAAMFDLTFIPITQDRYFWTYRIESENDPEIIAFNDMLKSTEFQQEVNLLAGYQCDQSGDFVSADDLLR